MNLETLLLGTAVLSFACGIVIGVAATLYHMRRKIKNKMNTFMGDMTGVLDEAMDEAEGRSQ